MRAFIDSNIFIYAAQAHREFGEGSIKIARDIEKGRLEAYTTSLNLSEVAEVIQRYDSKDTAYGSTTRRKRAHNYGSGNLSQAQDKLF